MKTKLKIIEIMKMAERPVSSLDVYAILKLAPESNRVGAAMKSLQKDGFVKKMKRGLWVKSESKEAEILRIRAKEYFFANPEPKTRLDSLQAKILAIIESSNSTTQSDVSKKIKGVSRQQVSNALAIMAKTGLIKRTTRGIYQCLKQ